MSVGAPHSQHDEADDTESMYHSAFETSSPHSEHDNTLDLLPVEEEEDDEGDEKSVNNGQDHDQEDSAIAGVALDATAAVEQTLVAIASALKQDRVFSGKSTSFGTIESTKPLRIIVHKPIANLASTVGQPAPHISSTALLLHPEEALFLMERGSLVLRHSTLAHQIDSLLQEEIVPKDSELYARTIGAMSLQEAYELLLSADSDSGCSIEMFGAYAYLRREGYLVFRCWPRPFVELEERDARMRVEQEARASDPRRGAEPLSPSHSTNSVDARVRVEPEATVSNTSEWEMTRKLAWSFVWGPGAKIAIYGLDKWILPLALMLFKRGGRRFQWRNPRTSIRNLRKFMIYVLKTVWKWIHLRVSLLAWKWVWRETQQVDLRRLSTDVSFKNLGSLLSPTQVTIQDEMAPQHPLAEQTSIKDPKEEHEKELFPDFEVYNPNSKFKKSSRDAPNYYLLVVRGTDTFPTPAQLRGLFARAGGVPVTVAVVEQGKISFLELEEGIVDPRDPARVSEGWKRRWR
ncbi:hypothetical protein BC830DRAFT_1234633 [Chytriomyces sp. MP71]|nr:hypothetical protein BC830DRAFT_1234633 [Chytriomyces sp. MP71]